MNEPETVKSSVRPATFRQDKEGNVMQTGPQPVDMTGFEGAYHKKDEPENAEPYGLQIVKDDQYGKTHHCKNQDHYWEGTEAEFDALFREGKGKAGEDEDLEVYTVEQLREMADEEGVDLTGITLKSDIIKAIEKHRKSK